MSLFKNFNLARFKKIKPPGDKSITTYSELKQLENIKGNRDFVQRKDEVYDVFKEVTDKYDIEYPGDLVNDLIERGNLITNKTMTTSWFEELEEKLEIDLSEERESIETVGDLISTLNEKLE